MNEFLSFILGVAITWGLGWLMTKTGSVGKYLIKVLSKIITDPKLQNKISNEVGVLAIKAGVSIIEATPDSSEVAGLVAKIKDVLITLEKEVKK